MNRFLLSGLLVSAMASVGTELVSAENPLENYEAPAGYIRLTSTRGAKYVYTGAETTIKNDDGEHVDSKWEFEYTNDGLPKKEQQYIWNSATEILEPYDDTKHEYVWNSEGFLISGGDYVKLEYDEYNRIVVLEYDYSMNKYEYDNTGRNIRCRSYSRDESGEYKLWSETITTRSVNTEGANVTEETTTVFNIETGKSYEARKTVITEKDNKSERFEYMRDSAESEEVLSSHGILETYYLEKYNELFTKYQLYERYNRNATGSYLSQRDTYDCELTNTGGDSYSYTQLERYEYFNEDGSVRNDSRSKNYIEYNYILMDEWESPLWVRQMPLWQRYAENPEKHEMVLKEEHVNHYIDHYLDCDWDETSSYFYNSDFTSCTWSKTRYEYTRDSHNRVIKSEEFRAESNKNDDKFMPIRVIEGEYLADDSNSLVSRTVWEYRSGEKQFWYKYDVEYNPDVNMNEIYAFWTQDLYNGELGSFDRMPLKWVKTQNDGKVTTHVLHYENFEASLADLSVDSDEFMRVYSIQGQYMGVCHDMKELSLTPGIYITLRGTGSNKVLVK